ncbi:hypothetical protein ABER23_11650 [Paenibacillus lautus]|uniref:hypothetical protein n=1 Tax=Paenibacillus lautus TaxID=1401 RepID=UPI003D2DCC25
MLRKEIHPVTSEQADSIQVFMLQALIEHWISAELKSAVSCTLGIASEAGARYYPLCSQDPKIPQVQ